MEQITQEFIQEASAGNAEAFEWIYRQSSGFVYNVALRIVSSRDDADEVTQDVFIAVYKNLKNFEFRSSFKTWIYRITINTAINFKKKHTTIKEREVFLDEGNTAARQGSTADQLVVDKEKNEQVNQLLDQLNEDQRACLVLRSVEGLSYEQIAEVLNVNINTVRTRIKRAREKLIQLRDEVANYEMQ